MLPRTESIFNIGEELMEEEPIKSRVTIFRGVPESLVGLRILIHHHHHHHHRRASNIVIKSALKSCEPNLRPCCSPKSLPLVGFLKACFFCRKALSLEKEVYMYRGDQGFCSVECRSQQILLDERREFEASGRKWQRIQHRHSAMPKIQESDPRRRITTRA